MQDMASSIFVFHNISERSLQAQLTNRNRFSFSRKKNEDFSKVLVVYLYVRTA